MKLPNLAKLVDKFVFILAIAFFLLQLYTAGTRPLAMQVWLHGGFIFILTLLVYPPFKGEPRGTLFIIIDAVLVILAAAFSVDVFASEGVTAARLYHLSLKDWIFGIACIVVVLEGTRRTLGLALPIIVIVFMAYAFLGVYIPGPLGHAGIETKVFVAENYLQDFGMYGFLAVLSNSFVFVIVCFGSLLMAWGAGDFLLGLALGVAGRFRGGPAKVAVIASACFGTISGSVLANVATTGAVTIPMMKRIGFRSEFAGAVEATASTGGILMPPVMGAVAFVMCQFLGIPYRELIFIAALPAILYFAGIFFAVDFEAAKTNMKGLPREEIPNPLGVIKDGWFYLIPIAVLVYFLVVALLSPGRACFYAILSLIAVDVGRQLLTRRRVDIGRLFTGFATASRTYLGVGCIMFCIGLIIHSIDISGLAIKLTVLLTDLSAGILPLLLVFTMIASIILGMGLPAVACYVFLATLAAPALVKLGVPMLSAHMFIFYYGLASLITPPVAPAAFLGAAIAKANPWKTSVCACRIGLAAFVVPWLFVYRPAILLTGSGWEIALTFVDAMVALFCISAGLTGFLLRKTMMWERILLIAIGIFLIWPSATLSLIGIGILVWLLVRQVILRGRRRATAYPDEHWTAPL